MEKNRIIYFDIAKGIGMLCVILGHLSLSAINMVVFTKSFPTCRTIEIIVQSGKIDICDCLITVWRQRTMEQRVF